jgi:hypothetical protein
MPKEAAKQECDTTSIEQALANISLICDGGMPTAKHLKRKLELIADDPNAPDWAWMLALLVMDLYRRFERIHLATREFADAYPPGATPALARQIREELSKINDIQAHPTWRERAEFVQDAILLDDTRGLMSTKNLAESERILNASADRRAR